MGTGLLAVCFFFLAISFPVEGHEVYEPSGNKEEEAPESVVGGVAVKDPISVEDSSPATPAPTTPVPTTPAPTTPPPTTPTPVPVSSGSTSSGIIRREVWGAEPPEGEIPDLYVNPPHFVMIAHTAGANCSSVSSCTEAVRNIQAGHLTRQFWDIGYNFLVGGDGNAYEGLGWGKKGAHTLPFNGYSIAIAFIGNFASYAPPEKQISAAFSVMDEGVKFGKLASDYKILYQKQVIAIASPGAKFIDIIEKWDRFNRCDNECQDIVRKWKQKQK